MATQPLRRTRQRGVIDRCLASSDDFRTAQQIHDSLRGSGETVGLATVYRTLQQMVEAKEVDVLRTPDGEASYRRCSTGHHHHLVCRSCWTAVEVSGSAVEVWAARVAAEHGFVDIEHDLEVYGTCAQCAAKG